ncbi:MAG TPA: hypothetical protein VFC07_08620 [Verrucomicrobiae bacterium]|nr:hypothetical protein [Verrucomicrobiae bacterium]
MIKSIGKLTLATILAAMVVGVPVRVSAQDKPNAPHATPAKPKATRFMGKLGKVDSAAKTITVENKSKERTFEITSATKITKDGNPATLSDGVAGEPVSGSYSEVDGKMVAKTVHFGKNPKKEGSAPAAPSAK